jgi:hypothetical protein
MYTFRFNPVFKQWVLLGEQFPTQLVVSANQRLDHGKVLHPDFFAVSHPRSPFLLDPPLKHKRHDGDLLFAAEAPVGEYEILCYQGEQGFTQWTPATWEHWLSLFLERFKQLHANPHLHFLSLKLHTSALGTLGAELQRVGDLVATSHPVAGTPHHLTEELLHKLQKSERLFQVHAGEHGFLYVPSAPLNSREVWYLPATHATSIDQLSKVEREELAHTMSLLMGVLGEEFPSEKFVLTFHTGMAGSPSHYGCWWVQIHQDTAGSTAVAQVSALPERFVLLLRQLLSHRKHTHR